MPEILVATVVSALVTAAAYKLFLRFSYQSRAQASIAAAQSELARIQTALEKNLRRAGYNLPLKCPGLNASSKLDTLRALVIEDNGGKPDGITVRGNFSETASQLTSPLSRWTAIMRVRAGGAKGFAKGDTLVIRDPQNAEWCIVTGVNANANLIQTRARLFDYQIGAEVILANSVSFRPTGTTLTQIASKRKHIVTKNLQNLTIATLGFDNKWDTSPPYELTNIQSLQYIVQTRVQKPGKKGWLYRDITGTVTLRNTK
jgi:Tfp pilus assembly protein PilW